MDTSPAPVSVPARGQAARQLLRDLSDWEAYEAGMYLASDGAGCAVGHLARCHTPEGVDLMKRYRQCEAFGADVRRAVAEQYGLSVEDVGWIEYLSDEAGDCHSARFEIAGYFGLGL